MLTCFSCREFVALLAGAILASTSIQAQITWHVDDDAPGDPGPGDPTVSDPLEDGSADHPFDAIQEGIDASSNGDTVLVLDGTYTGIGNKILDFVGRAIAVRSESGPENCIIDCEGDGRGFYFHSGEGSGSIIEGLTITNGYAGEGGGVYCSDGSPTLTNCTISGNLADYDGYGSGGGGLLCTGSSPTLTDCTITANTADAGGGGVSCWFGSSPTMINCTITANTAYYGGGVLFVDSSGTLANCTITANTATGMGGGVAICGSSPTLTNCTIAGNSVNVDFGVGGGMHCVGDCSPTLTNCTITANTAGQYGGGVSCWFESSPTFANCTITENVAIAASSFGGGVYCEEYSSPTLTNCVLWANSAVSGAEIALTDTSRPSMLAVSYSDVQGGEAAVYVDPNCVLEWGSGNIDADPLFVDTDGPDDDPNTWEDNDYRIDLGSPCIDAADNTAVPLDVSDLDGDGDTEERTPLDLDGHPRFVQDPFTEDTGVPDPPLYPHVVDMGAYEYQFCFGDLDEDNDIDLADLAQLLGGYGETSGMTYYDGDLDGDGDVDLADLAALLGHYGETCT